MPSLPLAVSIADILEVRGGPLREGEVWALLCQCAAAIQDHFIKGTTHKDGSPFAISPLTLNLCRDGQVAFAPGKTIWHGTDFTAPEYSTDCQQSMSDTAVEKMFLYTLGRTLQVATEYGLPANEYVNISRHLDSLLEAMCEENPTIRIGLRPVLEACDLHTRQHPGKPPYAQTVAKLYHSVLGPSDQTGADSSYGSDQSCQSTLNIRPRRRQARHRHHHSHRQNSISSPSPSPTRSCSRSRSRSRSRGTTDSGFDTRLTGKTKEPNESLSHTAASCASTIAVTSTGYPPTSNTTLNSYVTQSTSTLNSRAPSRATASRDVLNSSFASSADGHTLMYHTMPAYRSLASSPGLVGLHMGSPAYEKYLQLKERQHRLRAAQQGRKLDDARERLSAHHLMPPPSSLLIDYVTDARSMSSLMSYTLGSHLADLYDHFGPEMTINAAALDDNEQASIVSSDMSLLMPEAISTNPVSGSRVSCAAMELTATSLPASCLKRRHDDATKQVQGNVLWEQEQHLQKQHLKQFDSKLHAPSTFERHQEPREFYGPEFVHRGTKPLVRISLPLQGESQKNPALARRVIIVHLTGQKFEAIVDPCMSGRQLFDAVVTHTALDDFSFFGLTYLCDGEHFFLDADTKLHKMAPDGWREGAKGHMPPVTFTVFLRVKFYPESLAHFRHSSSEHLLYLQLRRDILEERCSASDPQLLLLTGLALQAEFGDYHCNAMGQNYFVPEQYLPTRIARRLGMACVHDRALAAHQEDVGLAASQCEVQFIKTVQSLPEYGVHFYKLMKVKNEPNSLAWLGITQASMVLAEHGISNRTITRVLPWPSVLKISFNKRRFSIQPKEEPPLISRAKLTKINFFTNSYRKGRYLLQFSTAQHRFHIHIRTKASMLDTLLGPEEGIDAPYELSTLSKETEESREKRGEEKGEDKVVNPKADNSQTHKAKSASSVVSSAPSEKSGAPTPKYRRPPAYRLNQNLLREDQRLTHTSSAVEDWLASTVDCNMHVNGFQDLKGPGFEAKRVKEGVSNQVQKSAAFQQLISSSPVASHVPIQSDSHLPSEVLPVGRHVFEVTLLKEGDKGIGITIVGGEATSKLDLGIFIKSVLKDGPAARDGRICAGDRLIAINGRSLEGVQHQEAVRLIRDSGQAVTLLVSQMRPPKTVRRKGDSSHVEDGDVKNSRIVNMEDPACHSDEDDICADSPSLFYSSGIPCSSDSASTLPVSTYFYDSSAHNSHHHECSVQPVHQLHTLSENIGRGSKEHLCLPLSAVHYSGVIREDLSGREIGLEDLESTNRMLLSDELLAAAELDKHSVCSEEPSEDSADKYSDSSAGDTDHALRAETVSDEEVHELEILGDIANMNLGNSDTDSDFESAVEATAKGRKLKPVVDKGSTTGLSKTALLSDLVVYEVVLEKEKGSLGFTCKDEMNVKSGKTNGSVYIDHVIPGGSAERGGILQTGDHLLEINGKEIQECKSAEIARVLRDAPTTCVLKVARTKSREASFLGASGRLRSHGQHGTADEPCSDNQIPFYPFWFMNKENVFQVRLTKTGDALGLDVHVSLVGIDKSTSVPVPFIQGIIPGSAASHSKKLCVGDVLLTINQQLIVSKNKKEIRQILESAGEDVVLMVCRPAVGLLPSIGGNSSQHSERLADGEKSGNKTFAVAMETTSPPTSTFASSVHHSAPTADHFLPVVSPLPFLDLDVDLSDEVRSNNTQSDVDSDVLDSSRSELEKICLAVEKYLDSRDKPCSDELKTAFMGTSGFDSCAGDDNNDCDNNCGIGIEEVVSSPSGNYIVTCSGDSSAKSLVKDLESEWSVMQQRRNSDEEVMVKSDKDNSKQEEFTVELQKAPGGGLGFTVAGSAATGGCYVKAVVLDPALSDGHLRPGDMLIQVNGQDMTGLSHFEAVTFLRQLPQEVSIRARRYTSRALEDYKHSLTHKAKLHGPPSALQVTSGAEETEECQRKELTATLDLDEKLAESADAHTHTKMMSEQQRSVKDLIRCLDTPKGVIRTCDYSSQQTLKDQNSGHLEEGKMENDKDSESKSDTSQSQGDKEQNMAATCKENIPATGLMKIVLHKPQGADSLGFSLKQRWHDGHFGFFINTVTPGGVAQLDGQLRTGDRLLEINGTTLAGLSQSEAISILREALGSVILTISRLLDAKEDLSHHGSMAERFTKDNARHTNVNVTTKDLRVSRDLDTDEAMNGALCEALRYLDNMDSNGELGRLSNSLKNSHLESKKSTPHSASASVRPSGCQDSVNSSSADKSSGDGVKEDKGFDTRFARQLSVEVPERITEEWLLSLPLVVLRKGAEESPVGLLSSLERAVELEEPLLEFKNLRQVRLTDNSEAARKPENKSKNRYQNVLPFDFNRVRLHATSVDTSDYINASHVRLQINIDSQEHLWFIACQGPLPSTVADFWRMVWQTEANVVAMLTQEAESGKAKCHVYWPQSCDCPLELNDGQYTVTLLRMDRLQDFDIEHLKLHARDSGESREIIRMHFLTWPDHGVPESSLSLLQFLYLMHLFHHSGPLVVHCSAGIGRTGVLITIDTALALIEQNQKPDICKIVSELRRQRYGMIQTQDQYLFCYMACIEALSLKK